MRILLVTQYFWPETFGINALASALRARGVEVTVLTGQPNYPEGVVYKGYSALAFGADRYGDIEVLRVPLIPRGKKSKAGLALNYLSFVVSGFFFGSVLLRSRRFNAVFVYSPSPLLQALPALGLAWLKRAPMALWVQDLWPESLSATGFVRNRWILGAVASVVRFIYRHTDLILVPSEAFREPIRRMGTQNDDIRYFPNACQEDYFETTGSCPEVAELVTRIERGFSVVFAGNLGTAQALDTLIDAAELLQRRKHEVRFYLVGSGSLSAWLAQEIGRRGLQNVVLTGRFSQEAMVSLYAAASALLVSLRDEPIFAYTIPSKVQGYLVAGRPVIASLNGEGARVVLEAEAGLTCPAGDSEALAAAVERMAEMGADARRKMGENARRYALSHFSLEGLSAELHELLASLSADYKGGRT